MNLEIIDNFLSHNDCDFLINYFKKSQEIRKWNDTTFIHLETTPISKIRISWIRYWFRKRIEKIVPIKLNYDQIVCWDIMSNKQMHRDMSYDTSVDWTVVCYLNDDFEGGETLVEDKKVSPKKGRVCLFPSAKLLHGVSLVKGNPRFTYISWWEEKT